jgi:predicted Zn finger-like uncharacterized protein
MAIEVIACPNCRHQLRVPDHLLGTAVRCPQCRAFFRAPLRRDDGSLTEPELLSDVPTVEPLGGRPPGRSPALVPGILLLLVGLIGLLMNGFTAYRMLFQTDDMVMQFRDILSDPNGPFRKQLGDQAKPEEITPERVRQWGNVSAIFAGVNLLIVLGAICILSVRFYGFSILTCVLAILDVWLLCCLISGPFGIWALIKLLDPQVRALFK